MHDPPSLLAIIARDYLTFGPRRLLLTGLDALRDRPEETARHMAAPTLVIRGERDALVSQEWAELIAARLPRGRAEVVSGHAHAVHYSAPGTVAALAAAFLLAEERQ
jgi:pimeloyl-ACP methyl ester carboxylesterase